MLVARLACLLAVPIAVWVPSTAQTQKAQKIDFNRDVRPILSNHCFPCHGPDAAQVAGDLRLDLPGEAKRVILAGSPSKSLLWQRVSHAEQRKVMPPTASGVKPLNAAQKEILRQWILQGGQYKAHWAFVPPVKPPLPKVKAKWGTNPIDTFILAELEEGGLEPEPEANRLTLLRRVSLTLTGLPPTTEEIDEFLADKRSDAYDYAVDRLLASPRYGEHQARYWLDAVRYGDTHGLHLDNERLVWPYRDWVVRAFNQDLPYRDFTIWQIAGDLLPNPTLDQMIATGYVRMNPTTAEGGAIEAEFLAKNTFDRVDTTSTVFLGLTVACARCHDHKYDPISQKDYFSLYAYFNSTVDKPLDDNALLPGPVIDAPSPAEQVQLKSMQDEITRREGNVDLSTAMKWVAGAKVEVPVISAWQISGPYIGKDFDDAFATSYAPEKKEGEWKDIDLQFGKPLTFGGKSFASTYVRSQFTVSSARELEVALQSDDGVKVWVNGKIAHDKKVLRGLADQVDKFSLKLSPGKNEILIKVVNAGGNDGLQLAYGDVSAERINTMAAIVESGQLDAKGKTELQRLYLEFGPESTSTLAYRSVVSRLKVLMSMIPKTLVAQELAMPRPAHILKRGEYSMPEGKVDRAIPPALGATSQGSQNRLTLAKWLASPGNPLTARVFVNRVWQQHFGTGLVKTSEDFGNQGEWPSHPELLDWLAVTFVEGKGSLKSLHRMIVTSNAFKQSAVISEAKRAKDPENRLISRGPRFRLDAEVIRDQALFVSGLLNEKMGGRGFKPPQPPGLWEEIAYPTSNTAKYVEDKGDSIYRRSLYLFWKRTSPHPIMLAFDSPMREMCTVRRPITNTPLQALVTLNEPMFQEAARALAAATFKSSATPEEGVARMFLQTVGRPPTKAEVVILVEAWTKYQTMYAAQPAQAEAILKTKGEKLADQAAWVLVATLMLNSDEFLTQH